MHQHRLFRLFGMQVWVTPPTFTRFPAHLDRCRHCRMVLSRRNADRDDCRRFLAAMLHQIVGLVHHLGHFVAARQTGYPMEGVVFGRWLFSAHQFIRATNRRFPAISQPPRAGGPIASALFGILASIVAAMLRESGGMAYWLAVFTMFDSLFLFSLAVDSAARYGWCDHSVLSAVKKTENSAICSVDNEPLA